MKHTPYSANPNREASRGEDRSGRYETRSNRGRYAENEFTRRQQADGYDYDEFDGLQQRPDDWRSMPYRDEVDGAARTWRRGSMGRDIERYEPGLRTDFGSRHEPQSRTEPAFSRSREGLGEYVGKGPKGYRRSDSRILEDVQEALTQDGSIDASDIDVSVNNGEVTLTGSVGSKSQKRAAEDCVEGLAGVKDVHNQLRVSQDNGVASNRAGSEKNKNASTRT